LTTKERQQLIIDPFAGYDPLVGRWLWLLTDLRRRTLDVLYHIVAVELDWLYVEILERPDYGPEVTALLPYEMREPSGRLMPVENEDLQQHLARLAASRQLLLDALRPMTADDFYRVRHLDPYDVTPEWVLYHLIEHEAGHRGEIGELRRQAELQTAYSQKI
jgi:uncharacterized damage-inducible protein DinB